MTDADGGADGVPPAVPLADDESALWTGRPRLSAAFPAGVVGLLVAAGGLALAVGPAGEAGGVGVAVAALAVVLGAAIPALSVLSLVNTRYVLTDRAASVKTGIVGRRVVRARLSMVENTAYRQSVTGSLFGYGTVTIETAGGDVAFRRVDDPRDVRGLVDAHTRGTSEDDRVSPAIPGSLDSWRAVREEVRLLRAAFEQ